MECTEWKNDPGASALPIRRAPHELIHGTGEMADLTRFNVVNNQKVEGDHQQIEIARALSGDPSADVPLKDGDVLGIRELTGWKDRGATIEVKV